MAEFTAITAQRTDPVSGKLVIGDATGHRFEWHKRVAGVDTAVASLSDTGAAMFATALRVAAFTAGTVVSDASGNFSVSASGGVVTGTGDWTGLSTANTVVALTGTASVVSMKASQLKWAADVNAVLSQVSQSGDVAAHDFALALQTPSGSATSTRRNSPSGSFVIPAPTAGGVNGRWVFYHDTQESLAIADSKVTLGVNSLFFKSTLTGAAIQFEAGAGASNTLTIAGRTSTDNVGGTTVVASGAGGGGNLAGDLVWRIGATAAVTIVASSPAAIVHLHGNSVRWSETSTPTFFQEQRTSDAACHDTTIQSQAPFSSAVTNRLPGNLLYVVPAPSDGTDPHGWHQFKISGDEVVKIARGVVSSHAAIQFMGDFLLGGTNSIYCERAAADADGATLFVEGQQGGPGSETNGGAVVVTGGIKVGTGLPGRVTLALSDNSTSLHVVQRDPGHSAVAIAGNTFASATDLPANFTNYLYLGNSSGDPFTPANGCVVASVDGLPYFLTATSSSFRYVGTLRSAVAPVGTLAGYVDVDCDGFEFCIPLHNRA